MTATLPTDLTSALAGRYTLQGILGRGGMATVYRAFDPRHQREVAVKVLRPEVAASLGAERFLAEIQTIARLTHPHILPLHDSGESQGFVYYVSPYIEGGSLRQRLELRTRFDVAEALDIARPVADAVAYAHRMGVVHRDLKPENILFSQGHPVVADFGIAKALSNATGRNLTRTGMSLGTPGYMSPEQAAGFHDLDERTDVYSLAVVIYELIVGEIPGQWPSDADVRAGQYLDANPQHRARLAAVGAPVERALVRAMAVRATERTATPGALMDDLCGKTTAPHRRYGADEVDEIVKRAAELEASRPTMSGAMTIGGVEAIAAEVGIDRDLVRSAAASLSPRTTGGRGEVVFPLEPPKPNRLIGGPTRIVLERVVAGEMPEADFPLLVDEIRRVFQNVGHVSQLGRSFSWTMSGASGRRRDVEVAIAVRGGKTRIVVQEGLGGLIGGTFGGIGGGAGGGLTGLIVGIFATMHMRPLLVVALPAWYFTALATARSVFYYASRARQKKLEALADRLASAADQLIHDQSTE